MIRKPVVIAGVATYDREAGMGYLYLVPREEFLTSKSRKRCREVKDLEGNTLLVLDFIDGRLAGIEFFGKELFPAQIVEQLSGQIRFEEFAARVGDLGTSVLAVPGGGPAFVCDTDPGDED